VQHSVPMLELMTSGVRSWPAGRPAKTVRRQAVIETHTTTSATGPRAFAESTGRRAWCAYHVVTFDLLLLGTLYAQSWL
jgi:hypothetical protein